MFLSLPQRNDRNNVVNVDAFFASDRTESQSELFASYPKAKVMLQQPQPVDDIQGEAHLNEYAKLV